MLGLVIVPYNVSKIVKLGSTVSVVAVSMLRETRGSLARCPASLLNNESTALFALVNESSDYESNEYKF